MHFQTGVCCLKIKELIPLLLLQSGNGTAYPPEMFITSRKEQHEKEEALDEDTVNLLPAAFFSSVMLASSSWTRLMFLSLSSATKDTCADKR